MSKIPAIPTRYAGCYFRSRLEARFAVLFTTLGWPWEYEPKGFSLPSGGYLPDFWITPGETDPIWFEVKPSSDDREDLRWVELSMATGAIVVVARGMHRTGDHCASQHSANAYAPHGAVARDLELWPSVPASAWDAASSARFEFGETPKGKR
jgi:hypothetical protein